MTPARRQTLADAIDLIRAASNAEAFDAEAVRTDLIGLGARFIDGNTNTMRLAGVTASCSWDKGEHLLTRWAANARTALQQADDQDGEGEEEE
jgi:hypothetical protein